MIEIKNIVKDYVAGDTTVHALKDISAVFRDSEFVSILGPSGCGKTTLLNVIGGLDQYNSGDLVIDGTSTKNFKDRDWDSYRNHKVGFVFQSYNLIMHLTVIENVELALSIAGDSKKEKRKKAIEALTKVGLYEQIHKKPNQLSGGQMQRVAIARAIVNNPSIILADEPTGALDTETSVQIMDILSEISKEHLVIMVTHNPELAKQYSTRILNLLDGEMVGDSNPVTESEYNEYIQKQNELKAEQIKKFEESEELRKQETEKNNKKFKAKKHKKDKKPAMKFFTAFKLSLRNLGTKKTRSVLTSFAGSIGIIGIALILALSNGFNAYIRKTESDTLSSYPLAITQTSADLDAALEALTTNNNRDTFIKDEEVYVNSTLQSMLTGLRGQSTNDLKSFKAYLDENMDENLVNAIQYVYNMNYNIFLGEGGYTNEGIVQLNPFEIPPMMLEQIPMLNMLISNMNAWQELLNNQTMLNNQYDLLGANARWPENENEVVVFVDSQNQINDYYLYALGLRDSNELMNMFMPGGSVTDLTKEKYTFDKIYNLTYKVLPEGDFYSLNTSTKLYEDIRNKVKTDPIMYQTYMKDKLENAIELKVVGIARPKQGVLSAMYRGGIGYSSKLTQKLIELNNKTQVVEAQINNTTTNVITGEAFTQTDTYSLALSNLKVADKADPFAIYFYPTDFKSKDAINVINKNIEKTHLRDKIELYNLDYEVILNTKIKEKLDFVYIDPPYNSDFAIRSIELLIDNKLVSESSNIIVETDNEREILDKLQKMKIQVLDKRKYGRAVLIFLKVIN